jgi:hypothetical protein
MQDDREYLPMTRESSRSLPTIYSREASALDSRESSAVYSREASSAVYSREASSKCEESGVEPGNSGHLGDCEALFNPKS